MSSGMKRVHFLFSLCCLLLLTASCSVSRNASSARGRKDKVIVGISRNGTTDAKRENFAKCIRDAGGEVYFFPTYPENDSVANAYLDRVDCLIIPGSAANDTAGRKYYDYRIVKGAIERGMPMLGICAGHQRINSYLGGKLSKVTAAYPESDIQHHIYVDGKNVGAQSEAHIITIDKDSKLYDIFGTEYLLVNTSHKYCTSVMSDKLKVVAVAPDGIVEAYEAPNILGLQFHPEYMYGNMGIPMFLKVFQYLVGEGRNYRDSKR